MYYFLFNPDSILGHIILSGLTRGLCTNFFLKNFKQDFCSKVELDLFKNYKKKKRRKLWIYTWSILMNY